VSFNQQSAVEADNLHGCQGAPDHMQTTRRKKGTPFTACGRRTPAEAGWLMEVAVPFAPPTGFVTGSAPPPPPRRRPTRWGTRPGAGATHVLGTVVGGETTPAPGLHPRLEARYRAPLDLGELPGLASHHLDPAEFPRREREAF
jgi:hypothetical protein